MILKGAMFAKFEMMSQIFPNGLKNSYENHRKASHRNKEGATAVPTRFQCHLHFIPPPQFNYHNQIS